LPSKEWLGNLILKLAELLAYSRLGAPHIPGRFAQAAKARRGKQGAHHVDIEIRRSHRSVFPKFR
jgi:hypothetical protein